MNIPKSIALCDFSHMLTCAFKAQANDAAPNSAGEVVLRQLAGIRSSVEHVIVCLDLGPYRRTAVYPGYKQGREREPEYGAIYKWTLDRLQRDGYNTCAVPGAEADDVMATLARRLEQNGATDVRLVTVDKDAAQLVTDYVSIHAPILGRSDEFEIRSFDWVKTKFEGLMPSQVALCLAIMGDVSDHIPGIKGIGIKGASKLIQTYGTIEKMTKACEDAVKLSEMDGKLPAFWKNFKAGMVELPRWLDLTTLDRHLDISTERLTELLTKRAPEKLVEDDDIERAAIQGELDGEKDEAVWDAVAAETEARERAELAASLPVGPSEGELRAEETRRIMRENDESARVARLAAEARERVATGVTDPSTGKVEGFRSGKAQTDAGAITSDAECQRAAVGQGGVSSSETTKATPAAPVEVVPPTRGPRKVDDIPQDTAIARVDPPSWALATQPNSAREMLAIAKTYINSRFYSQYGTPEGVYAVLQLGRELGLGMAASLESFHIVQGRPFAKAVTLRALAEKHPDCEWIMVTDADDKQATVKTKHRRAGELVYTYTIERAQAAGYLTGGNKDNWRNKTQEMLEARATSKAVRRWYPSAVLGMHSQEEAQDD